MHWKMTEKKDLKALVDHRKVLWCVQGKCKYNPIKYRANYFN